MNSIDARPKFSLYDGTAERHPGLKLIVDHMGVPTRSRTSLRLQSAFRA
jgi:hypothetical protein